MQSKRDRSYAIKRIERAIDAMVDLQDRGFGCDDTARILERLNDLRRKLQDY